MKTKRDNDSFYERRFCGARIMQMAEMWIYLINRKRLHFGFIFIRKLFAMSAHSQMFAHGRREENCLCEQQTAATATPASSLSHTKIEFLTSFRRSKSAAGQHSAYISILCSRSARFNPDFRRSPPNPVRHAHTNSIFLRAEWRAFLSSVFRLDSVIDNAYYAVAKNKNKDIKNAKADEITVMETRDLLFLIALKYINQNVLTDDSARIAIDPKMK